MTTAKGESTYKPDRLGGLLTGFKGLVSILGVCGQLAAGLMMLFLFIAGFSEMGKAVIVFFRHSSWISDTEQPHALVLTDTLKGLEYLFLAPLGYLVFLSLTKYLQSKVEADDNPHAERDVLGIKSLIANLMIAVITTDLVSKILSPGGLSRDMAVNELLVMAMLAGYVYLLEHVSRRQGKAETRASSV